MERILLAQINPIIGDFSGNVRKIKSALTQARSDKVDLVVFPELAISGYPPEDFLLMPHFIEAGLEALQEVIEATSGLSAIVGTFRKSGPKAEKGLYNSAAVIENGKLLGFQDKSLLPTYDVFDERRYFEPAKESKIFHLCGKRVAVTICEDIWSYGELTEYLHDPIADLVKEKPDLLVTISASPFHMEKFSERLQIASAPAKKLGCPMVLCNQVGGNDSLIFDGFSLFVSKEGNLISAALGFEEDFLLLDLTETPPQCKVEMDADKSLFKALVLGLRDYFQKSNLTKACIGLSGGIDSAVTLALAVEALGKENVLALMLPSRFSSENSLIDAQELVGNLEVASRNISIEEPFESFIQLMEPHFEGRPFDVTEENMQARIRGLILMAISNKLGYIVLGTGNKSELATGYSTLYGDMVGGLGVLSDVTKGQVYKLARYINRHKEVIPKNILEKPPSAELRPEQKDSDALPDYDIVDNVVEGYIERRLSPEEIVKEFGIDLAVVRDLIRRIHLNEYKRRQSAPGLRVSRKAFSIGRRFPIVQKWV